MPKIKEQEHVRIKEKSTQEGKEQITNVDNSRTDEKMVTTKPEAEKTEAPKKKKNIIRVYHAQNASDGGKNRPKRPASDKKPAARPQQRTQAAKPAETVAQKPAAETTAPKQPQRTPEQETPTAKPPVCKIIDYGKYRYELARKEKEARKKQKVVELKEIRLSPNIDSNDLNTKMNAAKKFLSKGDKVKITLRFRGREMAHMNASKHILDDFAESLAEVAVVEKAPKVEGRSISMVLAEKKS